MSKHRCCNCGRQTKKCYETRGSFYSYDAIYNTYRECWKCDRRESSCYCEPTKNHKIRKAKKIQAAIDDLMLELEGLNYE